MASGAVWRRLWQQLLGCSLQGAQLCCWHLCLQAQRPQHAGRCSERLSVQRWLLQCWAGTLLSLAASWYQGYSAAVKLHRPGCLLCEAGHPERDSCTVWRI